jgi:hypothetical protein
MVGRASLWSASPQLYWHICISLIRCFLHAVIQKYDNLDVLGQIIDTSPDARLPGLPSWVPDWSAKVDSVTWNAYIVLISHLSNYNASGGRPVAPQRLSGASAPRRPSSSAR